MSIFPNIVIMGHFRCYGNDNNVETALRIMIKVDNGISGLIPDKTKKTFVEIGPL